MSKNKKAKKQIKKKVVNKKATINRKVNNIHKQETNKVSADETTRMNEMLKIALSRQQPTIPTQDPNTLAMNRKVDAMSEKYKKQIDTLMDKINTQDRELASKRNEVSFDNRISELKKDIKDKEEEKFKLNEQLKANKVYQNVEVLTDENKKLENEISAMRAVRDSKAFKEPQAAYAEEWKKNFILKQQKLDEEALIEVKRKQMEEMSMAQGLLMANDAYYNHKKTRYDPRFIQTDVNGVYQHGGFATTDNIGHNKILLTVNGDIYKGNVTQKEVTINGAKTIRYQDDKGNALYLPVYNDNKRSDYDMYQIQLQEADKNYNTAKFKHEIQLGRKRVIDDLNTEYINKTYEIRKTEAYTEALKGFNDIYYDENGKPTEAMKKTQAGISKKAQIQATAEMNKKLEQDREQARKEELEAYKQNQYMKAMRDKFDDVTFKPQRDEITETQIRTSQIQMATEKTKAEIESMKLLKEQERQLEILRIAREQGLTPESLASIQKQMATDTRNMVHDIPRLNAYGEFTRKYNDLDERQKKGVKRVLDHSNIDIDALIGNGSNQEQYDYANRVIDAADEYKRTHETFTYSTFANEFINSQNEE